MSAYDVTLSLNNAKTVKNRVIPLTQKSSREHNEQDAKTAVPPVTLLLEEAQMCFKKGSKDGIKNTFLQLPCWHLWNVIVAILRRWSVHLFIPLWWSLMWHTGWCVRAQNGDYWRILSLGKEYLWRAFLAEQGWFVARAIILLRPFLCRAVWVRQLFAESSLVQTHSSCGDFPDFPRGLQLVRHTFKSESL